MIARLAQLVLAVGALVAGLAAGVSAWARAEASHSPQTVLAVIPWHAAALSAAAQEEAMRPQPARAPDVAPADAALRTLSIALLRQAPLTPAPLVYAGISAIQQGDAAAAGRAFEAALARSPRNPVARLWLASRAIEKADYPEAIRLLDGLIAIDTERSERYLDALAMLAQDPKGEAALIAALSRPKPWSSSLIARLNKSSPNIETLIALNARSPATQGALVDRVVRERGTDAAFIVWFSFLEGGKAASLSWPFNPEFKRMPASPPFNWSLRSDQAEMAEGGGLNVTYLGKGAPLMVDQTMLLRPGAYTFSALMEGEAKDNGGALAWSIECLSDNHPLGRVRAKLMPDKPAPQSFTFVVPADGCPAQRLALRGEPGEFPLWVRSTTHKVQVTDAVLPAVGSTSSSQPAPSPPAPAR